MPALAGLQPPVDPHRRVTPRHAQSPDLANALASSPAILKNTRDLIGKRSYDLHLWHFPVLVVLDNTIGLGRVAHVVALICGIASSGRVKRCSPVFNGRCSSRCCRTLWVNGAGLSVIFGTCWRGSCSAIARAVRSGTYPAGSGRARRCGSATPGSARTAPGTESWSRCSPMPTPPVALTGRCRSTPRSAGCMSTAPTCRARSLRSCRATRGNASNYRRQPVEPVDHAIGRYRGGLTTKLHTRVDGNGRPLVIEAGPGQGGDSPMLPVLTDRLRVPRCGPGRARTRPDALPGDKAYSSRGRTAGLARDVLLSQRRAAGGGGPAAGLSRCRPRGVPPTVRRSRAACRWPSSGW